MGNYDAFYKGQELQKNNMDDAPPVCSLFNEFRNILDSICLVIHQTSSFSPSLCVRCRRRPLMADLEGTEPVRCRIHEPKRDVIVEGLCPEIRAVPGLIELVWLPVPVPEVPEAVVAPGISIKRDLWCRQWLEPEPVVDTDEFDPRQPTE